jgi:hypothetical protein
MVTRDTWVPLAGQTVYSIEYGEVVVESQLSGGYFVRLVDGSKVSVVSSDLYPTEGTAVAVLNSEKFREEVKDLEIEIIETSEKLALADKEWLRTAAVSEITKLALRRIERVRQLDEVDAIVGRQYARVR